MAPLTLKSLLCATLIATTEARHIALQGRRLPLFRRQAIPDDATSTVIGVPGETGIESGIGAIPATTGTDFDDFASLTSTAFSSTETALETVTVCPTPQTVTVGAVRTVTIGVNTVTVAASTVTVGANTVYVTVTKEVGAGQCPICPTIAPVPGTPNPTIAPQPNPGPGGNNGGNNPGGNNGGGHNPGNNNGGGSNPHPNPNPGPQPTIAPQPNPGPGGGGNNPNPQPNPNPGPGPIKTITSVIGGSTTTITQIILPIPTTQTVTTIINGEPTTITTVIEPVPATSVVTQTFGNFTTTVLTTIFPEPTTVTVTSVIDGTTVTITETTDIDEPTLAPVPATTDDGTGPEPTLAPVPATTGGDDGPDPTLAPVPATTGGDDGPDPTLAPVPATTGGDEPTLGPIPATSGGDEPTLGPVPATTDAAPTVVEPTFVPSGVSSEIVPTLAPVPATTDDDATASATGTGIDAPSFTGTLSDEASLTASITASEIEPTLLPVPATTGADETDASLTVPATATDALTSGLPESTAATDAATDALTSVLPESTDVEASATATAPVTDAESTLAPSAVSSDIDQVTSAEATAIPTSDAVIPTSTEEGLFTFTAEITPFPTATEITVPQILASYENSAGTFAYSNCYRDVDGDGGPVGALQSAPTTNIEDCLDYCSLAAGAPGAPYNFANIVLDICYCGNTVETPAIGVCDVACTGDAEEVCGGNPPVTRRRRNAALKNTSANPLSKRVILAGTPNSSGVVYEFTPAGP